VEAGQCASIDTHNGVAQGHVTRIDAAVVNGTVAVDVGFDGVQPADARPDLSVDGTIEIEDLKDVLYVGRPVNGQAHGSVGMFKLTEDGAEALRVNVKLGRSSVNTIEVIDGLRARDKVILSDMSAWDGAARVRLK
jgi:HlyD family secretion protein